jgi:hypothetical protein
MPGHGLSHGWCLEVRCCFTKQHILLLMQLALPATLVHVLSGRWVVIEHGKASCMQLVQLSLSHCTGVCDYVCTMHLSLLLDRAAAAGGQSAQR